MLNSRSALRFLASLLFLSLPSQLCNAQDNHFRFMIIGDRTGGHVPGVFEGILAEVEQLQPDFCMTVGDHIEGYTDDRNVLVNQWNEYFDIEKILSMPIYHTPGNHDIIDATGEEIYIEHVGKPYYSFDHQGTHFVVLNSGPYGSQPIPDDQYLWLQQDLKEHSNADLTFVFFHHPEWWHKELTGKSEQRLLPLLEKHGVDAVFTGHWHRYLKGTNSGINYYTIGSSGGVMGEENIDRGVLFHYAHVAIDGRKFKVALLKRGSVLPDDFYTMETEDLRRNLETNWANVSLLTLGPEETSGEVTVSVNNPYKEPLKGQVRWNLNDSGWKLEPGAADFEVPPGASQDLLFHADGAEGSFVKLPSIEAGLTPPGSSKPTHVSKSLRATFRQDIPRLSGKVEVGKDRIDWPSGKVRKVLDRRYLAGDPVTGDTARDLSATLSMGWTTKGLCLGIVVVDDAHNQAYTDGETWRGDSVQIGIDIPGDNSESGYGPHDYEYTVSLTRNGPSAWRNKGTSQAPAGPAPDVLIHVVRDESSTETRYQILLPWKSLAPAGAKTPEIGLNLAINDDDGKGRQHWLELAPGIVQFKGPASFPRFTFARK